jgi:quercetin dioxygenase-like cupin family protein
MVRGILKRMFTVFGSLVVGEMLSMPGVLATPGQGFSAVTITKGHFDEFDVRNHEFPAGPGGPETELWRSMQATQGPSDVYVQDNTWQPGGYTGWHTHPGHSLIIVTKGTITAYEGDDPCTPHVYTVGQGFVDRGGDHVHLIANETGEEAKTVAVQITPAGGARRVDADAPPACQ